MKKNISYRDKLLDLAQIYNISEVKNYIKNKKKLTTPQIELILKKNKVPIPTEINKSILEIQSKKIKKPFFSFGTKILNFVDSIKFNFLGILKSIFKLIKKIFLIIFKGLGDILNGLGNIFSFISRFTISVLNNAYNFRVQEKKANKIVSTIAVSLAIFFISLGGLKVVELVLKKPTTEIVLNEKKALKLPEKKKEIVKLPEKKKELEKEPKKKKELVKVPEKKKKVIKIPRSNQDLILPDINLKTETVLTLFADVNYDLDIVRNDKLVKPIYFTQFPKDLDEISSVKLKKETFIKIVLPLVVAENQKILEDKYKLKKIISKKITSDKEKSWLRQKLREYKVKKSNISELEKRMDIIPVSIAIAQAAKESGWGTSRFALEGNAIFGQWTWNGLGIAPLDRAKEKSHKILRFPILRASVKAYKNNLNTHKSYKEFRTKRYNLRKSNKKVSGLTLIKTLDNYAETGAEYTKILKQIIEQNTLEDFNTVKLTNTKKNKAFNL